MSRYVFKLPDLGEGTVQAEIVGWRVKPGDVVSEDDVLVEVMTEKAAVEVPAPVSGKVVSTTGQPGDSVPVGSELVVIETASAQPAAAAPPAPAPVNGGLTNGTAARPAPAAANGGAANRPNIAAAGRRVLTSPAIRRRAKEAGIDLHQVAGSGPQGRIVRQDFEAYAAARSAGAVLPRVISGGRVVGEGRPDEAERESGKRAMAGRSSAEAARAADSRKGAEEIKVIGLRRLIAQRMSDAKRNIPHFAYVEEVDVTELESLRRHLNTKLEPGAAALTYLPFLALALVRVLEEFPQCNAHYDAERGVIVRYRAVHLGVATQTPDGLKVPIVRDAQLRSLWDIAAEMRRVTEAARTNKATREELSGSTITLTSLGKLGGIVSTPIINAPEVAIIGVNRAVERPMVIGGAIAVRRMMNLSSSFDHRFVDGYDAAAMVQALKERLEHPATLFIG
jgi:2-oxoisovalerate dehydrogenase E2 component (dihydrolipoyl transacylase)